MILFSQNFSFGKFPENKTLAKISEFTVFDFISFFILGVADFARCFCCGGGLRNWEAGKSKMSILTLLLLTLDVSS